MLLVILCFILTVTACSSKKNSVSEQQATTSTTQSQESLAQKGAEPEQQAAASTGQGQESSTQVGMTSQVEPGQNAPTTGTQNPSNSQPAGGASPEQTSNIAQVDEDNDNPGTEQSASSSNSGQTEATGNNSDAAAALAKPSKAIIITYSADCCASTKKFFEDHRTNVKELDNKYNSLMQFAWYDYSTEDPAVKNEIIALMKQYQVQLPAVVVVDADGNVMAKQSGRQGLDEVKSVLERFLS